MRRPALIGIALASAMTLIAAGPAAAHDSPDGRNGLEQAAEMVTSPPVPEGAVTDNFRVLGHDDLGGGGLNADVWGHEGFAYVGVWSASCPATGVKVVDIRRPTDPRLVSRLANPKGTSAEDVVVRQVRTPAFRGDLAVVGIQDCGLEEKSRVFRGLMFFDVTNPKRPVKLGRWAVEGQGCHEVDLTTTPRGQVLAGCANAFAEIEGGHPEVWVVDATDPRRPRAAGSWSLGRDRGVDPAENEENLGCFGASFAHSVRFDDRGRTLYASYWDHGVVTLDLRNPGRPRYVARADIAPPDEDGDVHSVAPARGGDVLLVNPEDFSPLGCADDEALDGWGEVHVVDNRDPSRARVVSTFSTPNSRSDRTDGLYSVHNTEVSGTNAFSSWYSDGIVWWSFADLENPVQRGQFVPPATEDPTGANPTAPVVWGVYLDRERNLVLVSDMNSGLWIVRPTGRWR